MSLSDTNPGPGRVVTKLPNNNPALGCKKGFKVIFKEDGEVDGFKAKLIAKGIDCQKTVGLV